MINYTEKGRGLHDAIEAAGYFLDHKDGVARAFRDGKGSTAIDNAVQAIIDGYDEIDHWKDVKTGEIKDEGVSRLSGEFTFLANWETIEFIVELWKSLTAKSPTPKFQKVIDIYSAGKAATVAVNGMTVIDDVKTYDAINTPSWP